MLSITSRTVGNMAECKTSVDRSSKVKTNSRSQSVNAGRKKIADLTSGKQSYKCHYKNCSKNFKLASNLYYHTQIHTGQKKFECDICGCRYFRKKNLTEHIILHMSGKAKCSCLNCTTEDAGGKKNSDRTHYCIYKNCHGVFNSIATWRQHLISVHGKRQYTCKWVGCDKKFSLKFALDNHMLSHSEEKKFVCDFCGYKTRFKSTMINHVRNHDKFTNFNCLCAYCQAVKAGGEKVVKSDGKQLHRCHIENCDETFEYSSYLIYHFDKKHAKEPVYTCEVESCNKMYSCKSLLKDHIRNHTRRQTNLCKIQNRSKNNTKSPIIKPVNKNSSKQKVKSVTVKSVNLVKNLISLPDTNQIKLVLSESKAPYEPPNYESIFFPEQHEFLENQQNQIQQDLMDFDKLSFEVSIEVEASDVIKTEPVQEMQVLLSKNIRLPKASKKLCSVDFESELEMQNVKIEKVDPPEKLEP